MKRTLLFTLLVCLFAFTASAQYSDQCDGCGNSQYTTNENSVTVGKKKTDTPTKKKKISVYPNPAVNFIGLSDDKDVKKITILNVMGREVKTFNVEKGMKYDVANMKRGMYLVQIFDHKNKIITTQRLNKR